MNTKQRKALCTAVITALAMLTLGCDISEDRPLTVVSWGGSYARACVEGYHEAFTAETGIKINLEDYNGGLAQIRAQVRAGNVHWDVVDLRFPTWAQGCDEGLLEHVEIDSLPAGADGTPAEEDFLFGTSTDCGVATLFYSTIYAYNEKNIPGEKPTTMADFFDIEKFPGRRGMRRSPQENLEFALIADGVPLNKVYATLDTPEGVDRAFRKLDTIKDHIVWWEAGAQPPQMLADGEVIMTTAYNGRIFNAQVMENQSFVIVWDGQILDLSGLAIVAGTQNLEAAKKFLNFAATARAMAGVSSRIAYSPTRHSAEALISTHAEKGVDMKPHMPNSPQNSKRALRNAWEWWSVHIDEMNERFSTWLAQ